MSKTMPVATLLAAAALLLSQTPTGSTLFLEKPYLQIGDAPKLSPQESLVLLWHTENVSAKWSVELRTSKDKNWRAANAPSATVVSAPEGQPTVAGVNGAKANAPAPPAIPAHLVYRAYLTSLVPGEEFRYRVLKDGQPVFDASAHARKSARQLFRFVLFGDCGQATPSPTRPISPNPTSSSFPAISSTVPAALANTAPSSFPCTARVSLRRLTALRCCSPCRSLPPPGIMTPR